MHISNDVEVNYKYVYGYMMPSWRETLFKSLNQQSTMDSPHTVASNAEFCVFFAVSLHQLVYKQTTEFPLTSWRSCDIPVM